MRIKSQNSLISTGIKEKKFWHNLQCKKDSNFAYNYYKTHYWDHFNFKDDRIIHTPLYDAKIDEYMNKLVLPIPDSVIKEGDALLAKARGTKEVFK